MQASGEAIAGSAIDLVATRYGDTGKEAQAKLVEDTLEAHPDLAYIVGTAVTAEAAIPILRSRGLDGTVKIASYYFTPGVDRGLRRGQIEAAPTDSPVIQGRVAIDQAVRILEGESHLMHVGTGDIRRNPGEPCRLRFHLDVGTGRLQAGVPG